MRDPATPVGGSEPTYNDQASSVASGAQRRSWWFATLAIGVSAVGSVWLLVWGVWWCVTHVH